MEMYKTLKFEQGGKEVYAEEGHSVQVTVAGTGKVYEGEIAKITAKEFHLTDADEDTFVIVIDDVVDQKLV